MARSRKRKTTKREKYASFTDLADENEEDADLPKDEAGRRKIKRQYGELLGIRIEKLRGRILNRERINKTIEGIYFICAVCLKVCHSLDEGLTEDPGNQNNLCAQCAKARVQAQAAAGRASARSTRKKPARRKRAAAG
ncbi:MAG TPA: hypothetical protein VMU16_00995 [Candidatus Binataceae bacterium]|nr:hypothetical protein [Candidatus Binataceae bacterium]